MSCSLEFSQVPLGFFGGAELLLWQVCDPGCCGFCSVLTGWVSPLAVASELHPGPALGHLSAAETKTPLGQPQCQYLHGAEQMELKT